MEVRKKLNPGDYGTKRHLNKYGEKLVCVRYRYDDEKYTRYTTVELIVDEQAYFHGSLKSAKILTSSSTKKIKLVNLKVSYYDQETRLLVKNAGGVWDSEQKYWSLDEALVIKLGLEKRIIRDA